MIHQDKGEYSLTKNDQHPIFEVLGGEEGCRRIARDFYARVAVNADLKPLFPGKSVRCATEEFAAFLIQFFDGSESQTQYRWWLSLRESHSRFQITEQQRTAWLGLMRETVSSQVEGADTQEALVQFFQATSSYVVGNGEAKIEHRELQERWTMQRSLDELIHELMHNRDAKAIANARKLGTRRSVLVGIFARMMEAKREPLIDFVLESLRNDQELAKSRFNGRTVLHFAASSSCLPVVRQLLSLGVDPDTLDSGGHSPLYRAASTSNDDAGAAVVEELVRAGATVDLCAGVNKSTPLHQAARFGNVRVANALLAAGANRSAKDKKGLTPLNRALNCRKHLVAKLLTAR